MADAERCSLVKRCSYNLQPKGQAFVIESYGYRYCWEACETSRYRHNIIEVELDRILPRHVREKGGSPQGGGGEKTVDPLALLPPAQDA